MDTVGIVGLGVVGGTVAAVFKAAGLPTVGYDPYIGIGSSADLKPCTAVFLCVPTRGAEDGSHDLTEVWSATDELSLHLNPGTVVAIKSTVPPGTCAELARRHPQLEFVSVPEFLVASRAVESFVRPDRIVIGSASHRAFLLVADLMSKVAPGVPIVTLSPTEAELVKLCSNAMLAAKVSMANELADVCSRFGVAWPTVQAVVGLDRRIGPDHLTVTPERGFGGECLPKDLDGLISASRAAGHLPSLLEEVATFNRAIRREHEAVFSESAPNQDA